MNTKVVMICSALFLGISGIALVFLPLEIATWIGITGTGSLLVFQLLGALYFGFGMLNWMAKGNNIGGIYNRPIAVANSSHFLIGTISILKLINRGVPLPMFVYIITICYALFSVLFILIMYRHPLKAIESTLDQ
jgi:hypothetical protein